MNETLLQAAIIADQNAGKCRKDKLWKWRACFFSLLFLQVRSRRVEQVEMQLAFKQMKTIFEFGYRSIIANS